MSIEKISTPVCIIGAGPAGCSTSLFLAKQKIQHIVLEKAVFPRDKICGDALSGKVLDHISELNPDWLLEISENSNYYTPANGISFFAPNYKQIDIPFPKRDDNRPVGLVAKRLDFDSFLFSKIDPNFGLVYQKALVNEVLKENGGYVISFKVGEKNYQIQTPILIGADGPQSIVSKAIHGRIIDDKSYSASVRAYYSNVQSMHPNQFLELHFLKGFMPGYLWIFPLPNGKANVGIGMLAAEVKKRNLNLRSLLPKLINQHPKLKDRFAQAVLDEPITGWGLPLGTKQRSIAGAHYMLVGDAAWLVDPFTGEGIGNAMLSGKLAAQFAAKALATNNFNSTLQEYQTAIYQNLGSELKLSYRLQKLSSLPVLFNLLVNRASKSPTMQDTLTCMFNDLEIRARLKKPSFYFSLLFN